MYSLKEVQEFIDEIGKGSPSNPAMEDMLFKSVGYSQYVGELENQAETIYAKKKMECLEKLSKMDDETETTRQAKLNSWTAEEKETWRNLRLMNRNLKTAQMSLMVAMKNRREEAFRGT